MLGYCIDRKHSPGEQVHNALDLLQRELRADVNDELSKGGGSRGPESLLAPPTLADQDVLIQHHIQLGIEPV